MKATKAFQVTYTKRIGGNGTIIVKAHNEDAALSHAKNLCFTGSDFRDAIEVPFESYTKPSKQGFQGSGRQN